MELPKEAYFQVGEGAKVHLLVEVVGNYQNSSWYFRYFHSLVVLPKVVEQVVTLEAWLLEHSSY